MLKIKRLFTGLAFVSLLLATTSFLTAAPPLMVGEFISSAGKAKKYRTDSILVKFKPGTSVSSVNAAHGKVGPKKVKNFRIVPELKHVVLPAGKSLEEALSEYRKNPNVLYAEPDYQYELSAVPNDTYYSALWPMQNTGQDIPILPYAGTAGSSDADINIQEAWDNIITPPGSGAWNSTSSAFGEVVVAVIDTGIDYTHPDLSANMWVNSVELAGTPGVDDDTNGYIDDIYGYDPYSGDGDPMDIGGHGTHVAGTIAAEGNNATGVVGVAWNAKLIACRIGATTTVDNSAAIECLDYLYTLKVDQGVNVVVSNNSWGGTGYSQALYDAIKAQQEAGILFVAAAGNSNTNNDNSPHYPSNYHLPNVISVANTTNSDAKSTSSSYGRRSVHVAAPGDTITSTMLATDAPHFGTDYGIKTGTSMAAPHVAGLVALLYSQDNARDWRAIKNLILSAGTPVAGLSTITTTGRRIRAWDSDGTGATTCSNQTVNAALQPQSSVTLAQAGYIGLAALNINCDVPAGNMIVTTSGPSAVADSLLLDNGAGYDIASADGVYSGYWHAPSTAGAYTLTYPDGQTVAVTVDASMNPYRQGQSITPTYETFTDYYAPFNFPDGAYQPVSSTFPIKFGDNASGFTSFNIGKGWIGFHAPGSVDGLNSSLPSSVQNTYIVPFWDDLNTTTGSIHVGYTGTTPNKLVVEWRNMQHNSHTGTVTFQVVFTENSSDVQVNYADVTFGSVTYDQGASATIGMQIHNTSATQFSYNTASISDNSSYLWQTNSGAPTSVNAGPDQNISGHTSVNLSGSATDPDGGVISYSWAQVSGTSVTLTDSNTATPSFTAPNVTETLSFIMTVTDDAGFTGADMVDINVTAAPTSGVLALSNTTYSVAENGTTATITVSRTGGSTGAVSVDYATSDGTATTAGDYSAASGTLNWIDGDSADKTFSINITNDGTYEVDETLGITLSNAVSASLGTSSATLTITDDDAVLGTLALSSTSYSVAEGGGTATITVSRTGGSDTAVSVDYATSNGTATAGSDYTTESGTLSWSDGDSADKSFTVTVTDDASYELDETINLTLSNVSGATLGTSSATLTITDNDAVPGSLALSSATYTVAESGGTATITVSRTGGSDGAVSVDYATLDDTASAGSDYTAASGTLNWADGDSANKTFAISITDDVTYEGDETVSLTLSNVVSATLGTSGATLTITENDPAPAQGVLGFDSATYTQSEDGSSVIITVNRIGGSSGPVSVEYATIDGTATAGSDYTSTSGILEWTDTDVASKTFTILITNDSVYEPDETVTISLSNVVGTTLSTSSATLTITNDDPLPNAAPNTPTLISLENNSVGVDGSSVTFEWNKVTDPDGDAVSYQLYYCTDAGFSGCSGTVVASLSMDKLLGGLGGGMGLAMLGLVASGTRRQRLIQAGVMMLMVVVLSACSGGAEPESPAPDPNVKSTTVTGLLPGTTYYWKVVASDGNGGSSESAVWQFTTN